MPALPRCMVWHHPFTRLVREPGRPEHPEHLTTCPPLATRTMSQCTLRIICIVHAGSYAPRSRAAGVQRPQPSAALQLHQ
eukprot:15441232-Alexandrium_andersonii.AAC.1